ncbi:MAG: hypothetical protein WDO24_22415 [Pseudomonadota bacterium]
MIARLTESLAQNPKRRSDGRGPPAESGAAGQPRRDQDAPGGPERMNQELEDTNRGVVALYGELDERADHLRKADEIKNALPGRT